MKKIILFLSFLILIQTEFAFAQNQDYDFNLDEFEKKSFDCRGYLSLNPKITVDNKEQRLYSAINELQIEPSYKKDWINLKANFSFFAMLYSKEDNDYKFIINNLYQTFGEDFSLSLGKQSLKWGKGYIYNPIAFLDRVKNPLDPESVREGYYLLKLQYIQTPEGDILQNHSFTFVYMPSSYDLNKDFYTKEHSYNNVAFKYYALILDTDIDLIYMQEEKVNKYGIDLSKNLSEELEVHGELSYFNEQNEYLIGFKYAAPYDLTLTTEYYKKQGDNFIYNKLSQKDAFGIIYSTAYVSYQKNLDQNKYQVIFSFKYDFKNGFVVESIATKSSQDKSLGLKTTYYF
ncbi:MAG: hypothetical protein Q9M37_06765 [Desulfonauticus sp.]|nr:hypothetical protein [Desulfonauticus sp.]